MKNTRNLLKNFQTYLRLERSLSGNTLLAYTCDIEKLYDFLDDLGIRITQVSHRELSDFIQQIAELGIAPRTQARIISGIKAFYRFLILESVITDDPSSLLESPRLGRKLPEVLSTEEINALVAAVDLSKAEGQRNKAILETLYGCGLRVTELIELKISHLYFKEAFVKVRGKGNKERLVPISQTALNEIVRYLETDRCLLDIKPGQEDFVFLNRRGSHLTRVMIFTIVKNLAVMANIKKEVSPHTFRHSFATHLLEGGANLRVIQQMLGHSSIITTEIYTHLDRSLLMQTINEFHPRA